MDNNEIKKFVQSYRPKGNPKIAISIQSIDKMLDLAIQKARQDETEKDLLNIKPDAYILVLQVKKDPQWWATNRIESKRKFKDLETAKSMAERLKKELKLSKFRINVRIEGVYVYHKS